MWLLVTDLRRGPDPWFVLTGDTLFVGAVGRPDLPGQPRENASELYDSIHTKLLDASRRHRDLSRALLGFRLRRGHERQAVEHHRLREAVEPDALARPATEFVDALADVPPKPAEMERDSPRSTAARRTSGRVSSSVALIATRGAARPSREPRAVLAAGPRQRVRRRDGRHGAHHPAADRRAGLSSGRADRPCSRSSSSSGSPRPLTNYLAGASRTASDASTCSSAGWLVAVPVPFLLMWAPTWTWVLVANALPRCEPGSHVVDHGHHEDRSRRAPKSRGLAMGLNEFAGYVAVAAPRLRPGVSPPRYGLRPEPFYLGVVLRRRWALCSPPSSFARRAIMPPTNRSCRRADVDAPTP